MLSTYKTSTVRTQDTKQTHKNKWYFDDSSDQIAETHWDDCTVVNEIHDQNSIWIEFLTVNVLYGYLNIGFIYPPIGVVV